MVKPGQCVPEIPVLEGRDRRIPGIYWPASLAELLSFWLNKRPYLKKVEWGLMANTFSPRTQLSGERGRWFSVEFRLACLHTKCQAIQDYSETYEEIYFCCLKKKKRSYQLRKRRKLDHLILTSGFYMHVHTYASHLHVHEYIYTHKHMHTHKHTAVRMAQDISFCGCCSKWPRTLWLKTTEINFFVGLGTKV